MDEDEKKLTPVEVQALVPFALDAIAELLNTTEEKLPAGLEGILENFGASCFQEGVDNAHTARTVPSPEEEKTETLGPPGAAGGTNPSFPPPLESLLPEPGKPSVFSRPTRPPPGGKKPRNRLPLPPRLPKGLTPEEDDEK